MRTKREYRESVFRNFLSSPLPFFLPTQSLRSRATRAASQLLARGIIRENIYRRTRNFRVDREHDPVPRVFPGFPAPGGRKIPSLWKMLTWEMRARESARLKGPTTISCAAASAGEFLGSIKFHRRAVPVALVIHFRERFVDVHSLVALMAKP